MAAAVDCRYAEQRRRVESSSTKSGQNFNNTFFRTRQPRQLNRCVTPAAAIDRIDHFVVHGDDVPLIAVAIDAEANGVASQIRVDKDLPRLPWFWISFVGAWCGDGDVFFLLISFLGPDLKFEVPRKGLT